MLTWQRQKCLHITHFNGPLFTGRPQGLGMADDRWEIGLLIAFNEPLLVHFHVTHPIHTVSHWLITARLLEEIKPAPTNFTFQFCVHMLHPVSKAVTG